MPAGQLSIFGLYALKIDLMILEKITLIMQNLPIYLHGGFKGRGASGTVFCIYPSRDGALLPSPRALQATPLAGLPLDIPAAGPAP